MIDVPVYSRMLRELKINSYKDKKTDNVIDLKINSNTEYEHIPNVTEISISSVKEAFLSLDI